ncbi:MAG TPA: Glu/Leu/Phe/Val dehydrogenase [Gracilimonas sp.]|uniref:Glu/Leu/Phe/Val family dehydrogenase n=1 Tax=Gracilimonas sp. TaxID=1974203 RepID=UPI002D96F584|nr:Glu/Leu/Phe/Val dehydrogenase [Gracilimonas sp.]
MTKVFTKESKTLTKENKNFPLFNELADKKHEQVVICSDPETGLRAIIAIHNTTLGPALGGTRMWNYESEEAAMKDVLRLSRGMTYKSAISGLNLGGGKAVIIGDPHTEKTEALFRSFGRFVDGLGGRYITAEDVGMTEKEMEWIYSETKYVTGIPKALGGSGNPSPVTAYGVYMGVKACAKKAYGSDSLEGKKIALQGAGNVASYFARHAAKEGAELFICDIYGDKANELAKEVGAEVVDPDSIYGLDVDIFTPCALGGVINDDTLDQFKCDIIAGGANNVLDVEDKHGEMLLEKGIIYAPDYVINAGGIINIASELEGYNEERALQNAGNIYTTITDILNYSEEHGIPAHKASNALAEKRIETIGNIKNKYSSKANVSGRLGEVYKRFID